MIEDLIKEDFLELVRVDDLNRYRAYKLNNTDYILYLWERKSPEWVSTTRRSNVPFGNVFNDVSDEVKAKLIYYMDLFIRS